MSLKFIKTDAGASTPKQASQRMEQRQDSWRAPAFKLQNILIFGAPNINALVKRSTLVHYNGP
jgi:hypothetical protein